MTVEQTEWDKVRGVWEVIDRLRGEGGCPWDRKQTPESVQAYLIEEAHEAAAAVRAEDEREVCEELGDLLFMVLFMTHLYNERDKFRISDVCDAVVEKMIRRHPHVFGDVVVHSTEEVKGNWEKIKAKEKAGKENTASPLPDTLPALMRAHRMVARMAHKDSRWNDFDAQKDTCALQLKSLRETLEGNGPVDSKTFGKALFLLANLARLKDLRAEECLQEWMLDMERSPGEET